MAALQSRAAHRPVQRHANDEGEAEVIRGRPQHQRIIREQDSWILFAPVKPAQAQVTEHGRSPIDSRITSSSQATAQATSQDTQTQDGTLNDSGKSSDNVQTSSDTLPLSPPLISPVNETADEISVSSPALSNDTTTLPSESCSPGPSSLRRWTVLPTPNASYLFDDEQDLDQESATAHSIQEHSPLDSRRVIDGSIASANTELLSIPSSVTLSERSASTNASPRQPHSSGSQVRHRQEPSDALTAAALSKMAATADSTNNEEADLTSGSEEEDAMDVDEALLARAPDAMSAGIRPIKRAPLQRISLAAASQSSGRQDQQTEGHLSASSAVFSTASKRRHRKAGTSEKGSKRSQTNTDASARASKGKAAVWDKKSKERMTVGASRRSTFSLGEAARHIFQVDRDVMEAFSQHGTVYHQPLPQASRSSLNSKGGLHGYEAFAAQAAADLGDSPHTRYLFTGAYPEDLDADYHEEIDNGTPSLSDAYDAHSDLHTASLGLHRHFSLSSLHHFLVESVYGALPSLSKVPGSAVSDTDQYLRKRASSVTALSRSPMIGEAQGIAEQAGSSPEQYNEAVSYWRRILRSFVA